MVKKFFLVQIVILSFWSCSIQQSTCVITGDDEKLKAAGEELVYYLSKTYPTEKFETATVKTSGGRNIFLNISDDLPLNNEGYSISGFSDSLVISGKTHVAISNGVFGLLKTLGWNFYLSFEVPPASPKPLDFSSFQINNAPLKEKRIIFNWHNFLSGCTGWDYPQWRTWIDNSAKIGFNTIMVHAYGNNPIHTFSWNGQEKGVGYLTTTQRGSDWGAQHVNDVRLLYGGKLFNEYEYGSLSAKVNEKERINSATLLMQQVFRHAAEKGMGVCFALDVDTWMSNPQNIIKTLPSQALIEIGGYLTADPEHPAGKEYYKAQLKKLLSDYPQISILTAWIRRPEKQPGHSSVWLLHDSASLPEKWKKEYLEIVKKNPSLTDERPYPGLFAVSKIIKVYREILDEINPSIELALGSWEFNYTRQADLFMPEYCSYIPLDYNHDLDQPEVMEMLNSVGKKRKVYPVVWAQHDDSRYIGRPYFPYSGFSSILEKTNSSGYGIIHWMTHPLDMIFTNYENQVWYGSKNQTPENTVEIYTHSLLKRNDKNLYSYFKKWFSEAPMFTWFIKLDEDYHLDGYKSSLEVIEKARQRLVLLNSVSTDALNDQGKKELLYQIGMEKFIISFFNNHYNGYQAYTLLQKNNVREALPYIKLLNPEETVKLYAETISNYGPTRGEEGVLISLNLRWLSDYIDLKQRAGEEPIRINYQKTFHDPLAQGTSLTTFFIDEQKNAWSSEGKRETSIQEESNGKLPLKKITDSWLNISKEEIIELHTMRKNGLSAGDYELQLYFAPKSKGCKLQVFENQEIISTFVAEKGQENVIGKFSKRDGRITIKIIPEGGQVLLSGIKARNLKS